MDPGSDRLTYAAVHACFLGEIVVFIAPAPSIDKVITGVLLGIKIPAWKGCAARPGHRLGSTVFWEQKSRGAQMSRDQGTEMELECSRVLECHTVASQGRTVSLLQKLVNYRHGQFGPLDTLLYISSIFLFIVRLCYYGDSSMPGTILGTFHVLT